MLILFVIELKNINNKDDIFKFNEPLTFTETNDMLLESIKRYRIKGVKSRIGFKIINQLTRESVLNSRIAINGEIESFFSLINENKNITEEIKKYASDVAIGKVEEVKSILLEDGEYKIKVDELRKQKEQKMTELQEEELKTSTRELEHQETVLHLQQEIEQIESTLKEKDTEDNLTHNERLKQIEQLEIQRKKTEEQVVLTREEEKRKKKRHENELAELEEQRKTAETELITVKEQSEIAEIERKKRKLALEEEERTFKMKVELIQTKDDLEESKVSNQSNDSPQPLSTENSTEDEIKEVAPAVNTPVIEEEELNKYIIALNKTWHYTKKTGVVISKFLKISYAYGKKGSRLFYLKTKRAFRNYRRYRFKKKALDIQVSKAKINFVNELNKERQKQDVELKRKEREKAKIQSSYIKKQERYLKEIKRKNTTRSSPLKTVLKLALAAIIVYLIIDFSLNRNQSYLLLLQESLLKLYATVKSAFVN